MENPESQKPGAGPSAEAPNEAELQKAADTLAQTFEAQDAKKAEEMMEGLEAPKAADAVPTGEHVTNVAPSDTINLDDQGPKMSDALIEKGVEQDVEAALQPQKEVTSEELKSVEPSETVPLNVTPEQQPDDIQKAA